MRETRKIFTVDAAETRDVHMKAAKFMFHHIQKDGHILQNRRFYMSVVDESDIEDGHMYYGGFLFSPSISVHVRKMGHMKDTEYAHYSLPRCRPAVVRNHL